MCQSINPQFATTLDEMRHQIDTGHNSEAQRALSALLDRDSKHAEAWWLYAQVAEDKNLLYKFWLHWRIPSHGERRVPELR